MYTDDAETGNCLNCYLSNGQCNFSNEYANYSPAPCSLGDSSYYDANAKIQNDLNVVRDCLGYRLQTEEEAVSSLLAGKAKKK